MILGRPALMRLRVSESGEVVQLTRDQMHALIQTDAEISEVLMKALIYRRIELVAQGIGDVLLIGSAHSAATLRIKAFLTRNGHPFKYLDLDRDADVRDLLDRFHVDAGRNTRRDLPRRGRAEESQQSGDCRPSRLQRADRPGSPARCRHRRRRTSGSCGRGLRGFRGTRCAGHRGQFAWRTGGIELENRELPRISNRDFRPGAGRTRLCPGAEVWRRRHDRERRRGADLRTKALRRETGRRRDHPGSHSDHRHRRPIPEAVARESRSVRRCRCLLQRDLHGGSAARRRRRGHRRRRGQLGRSGRGISGADGETGSSARPIRTVFRRACRDT